MDLKNMYMYISQFLSFQDQVYRNQNVLAA